MLQHWERGWCQWPDAMAIFIEGNLCRGFSISLPSCCHLLLQLLLISIFFFYARNPPWQYWNSVTSSQKPSLLPQACQACCPRLLSTIVLLRQQTDQSNVIFGVPILPVDGCHIPTPCRGYIPLVGDGGADYVRVDLCISEREVIAILLLLMMMGGHGPLWLY